MGDELRDVLPDIVNLTQGLQQRDQLEETPVSRVIVPRKDGDSIFLMKGIRSWWIVNDQAILHRSTQQRHILDIDSLDGGAVLSEKPKVNESSLIQDVNQGIRVFT